MQLQGDPNFEWCLIVHDQVSFHDITLTGVGHTYIHLSQSVFSNLQTEFNWQGRNNVNNLKRTGASCSTCPARILKTVGSLIRWHNCEDTGCSNTSFLLWKHVGQCLISPRVNSSFRHLCTNGHVTQNCATPYQNETTALPNRHLTITELTLAD